MSTPAELTGVTERKKKTAIQNLEQQCEGAEQESGKPWGRAWEMRTTSMLWQHRKKISVRWWDGEEKTQGRRGKHKGRERKGSRWWSCLPGGTVASAGPRAPPNSEHNFGIHNNCLRQKMATFSSTTTRLSARKINGKVFLLMRPETFLTVGSIFWPHNLTPLVTVT